MGLYGDNGKENENYDCVVISDIEHGIDGDLLIIYPKPYSNYLRGTIHSGKDVTQISVISFEHLCGDLLKMPRARPVQLKVPG